MNIHAKKDRKRLRKHIFFEKANYWVNYQIDNIKLPSRRKENMAKRFLCIYVTTFEDILINYINRGDYEHPSELIDLYLHGINEVKMAAMSIGVPKIFLDKYEEHQDAQTSAMYEQMKSIVSSNFYETDIEKIIAIFDTITYAFIYIILNAEKTLLHMNGELEHALEGTIFDN